MTRHSRIHHLWPVLFGLLVAVLATPSSAASKSNAGLPPEIIRFVQDKESQARALAKKLDVEVSPDVWAFFRTAQTGTIPAITNAFESLKRGPNSTVSTPVFETLIEVILAVQACDQGDPAYSLVFGKGVIRSIPAGSIYFGGNGPELGLIEALSKSHAKGDPFFTITQNSLTDGRYLQYLRAMYGDVIRTPSTNDSTTAYSQYLADARKRLDHDGKFPAEPRQIKPGEDVKLIDDRVQISGYVALMGINAQLAKLIFDANPGREFYFKEGFPLEWMNPYLVPHEWIFKLNREPVESLTEDIVKKDRDFWIRQQKQVIGAWLTPATPVKDVCDFASKTFGRKEFSDFKGDRRFIENRYTTRLYSKLRSSMGRIYHWRVSNSRSPRDKQRMLAEADFAFRQSFAFCPYSPETVFMYVNLLISADRIDDALRVGETAETIDPENNQYENLVTELTRIKHQKNK